MKARFRSVLQILSASLALALLSGGCAMMAPKMERYVAPPLGSTWVTARRDTGSYGSGSMNVPSKRADQMWQGKQMIGFESPEGTTLADSSSGDWHGVVKGSTPLMTWDPPLGWNFPLEVGKTWTKATRVTIHAANRTVPYEYTQKVEAYEEVTVPAGTFKAFKMTTSDTIGNENVQWFSPELGIFVKSNLRRTAKNASGPGTREAELVSQNIKK